MSNLGSEIYVKGNRLYRELKYDLNSVVTDRDLNGFQKLEKIIYLVDKVKRNPDYIKLVNRINSIWD